MNKQELIDAVAGQTGASKAQTGETLDTLLEVIKKAAQLIDTKVPGDAAAYKTWL